MYVCVGTPMYVWPGNIWTKQTTDLEAYKTSIKTLQVIYEYCAASLVPLGAICQRDYLIKQKLYGQYIHMYIGLVKSGTLFLHY